MKKKQTAAILVLGDLNRSPRMLNHCKAITETMDNDIDEVSLIGFQGGDLRSDISTNRKIKVYYIPEKINNYLKKLPKFLFLLSALIRIILQIFYLFYILLFKIPAPNFLILQNPPGIPAIYICSIVCFLRRSTFIIDWHNYGYTILEVNRRNKLICYIAKIYEKIYGRCAQLHLCVSEAMKNHLKQEMGIDAINLPDRAIKNVFHRLCLSESYEVFQKYEITENKLIIKTDENEIKYKEHRPILMISSTSWTPDEDFDILLESFKLTEDKLMDKISDIRKVLFLITGKGQMRDEFMKKIEEADLKIFNVKSIWLESDDYPKILGSADLGVCLHYSSSGFDLPMKVVDMFSAGLPVAAIYYPTILELVKPEVNGFLFKNSSELSEIFLKMILEYSYEGNCEIIEEFRKNLKDFSSCDWVYQWDCTVQSIISKKSKVLCKKPKKEE